jgi:outer membrane immunogenic protein
MKKLAFLGVMVLVFSIARTAHAGGNWTGFYVGGNAGYAWGSASNTLAIADGLTAADCHFCAVMVGGNDAFLAQNAGSPSFNPNGFAGGGQVGFNWQNYNWVYGLELDFESFSQNQTLNSGVGLPANSAAISSCASGGTPVNCVGNFSTSVKTDWLLSIRPRIGYAWDQTLIYVTGGLALTKMSLSQSYIDI